jgi:hypothetical protein
MNKLDDVALLLEYVDFNGLKNNPLPSPSGMFTRLESRLNLTASFERWTGVDVLARSELSSGAPSVLDVRSLKEWLDANERWRADCNGCVKAAAKLDSGGGRITRVAWACSHQVPHLTGGTKR